MRARPLTNCQPSSSPMTFDERKSYVQQMQRAVAEDVRQAGRLLKGEPHR